MPIVMGPPAFVTISDIRTVPTATGFTVTFTTDQSVQCALTWTADTDAPSIGGGPLSGTVNDAAATTVHSIAVTPAQAAGGKTYLFSIGKATTDTTGLVVRPRDGFVQLTGARTPTQPMGQSVPVKFYQFGDTPPAPAGGGPSKTKWSTYVWAQYAPKAGNPSFAGAQTALLLRAGPGTAFTATITTAGTIAFTLHDDAGTGTGPVIYTSPAATTVGQVLQINQSFVSGLTLVQAATGPSGTVQVG
jgi:hypothetical protein